jgi:hypothetical protein
MPRFTAIFLLLSILTPTLTVIWEMEGSSLDPSGQPRLHEGGSLDPDGQSKTDEGSSLDPNGRV